MSGSAVNRGGVKVEFRPDVDKPQFAWAVKMRNHVGFGASPGVAFDELLDQIAAELTVAKAARASYRGDSPEKTT